MPGAWEWWAAHVGSQHYNIGFGDTREAVIADARRNVGNRPFEIIEARSSSAAKYEGADFVPFVATRNHEVIPAHVRAA